MRRAGASTLREAARLQRIKAEKKKRRRVLMAIIGSIAGAVLIIVIVIVNIAKSVAKSPTAVATVNVPQYPSLSEEEKRRINCYPEQDGSQTDPWNISEAVCKQRGCEFWKSRNPYAPICYMSPSKIGYRNIDSRHREDQGTTDFLLRRLTPNGIFGNTSFEITMSFIQMSNQIFRLRITEKSRLPYISGKKPPVFRKPFDLSNEGLIRSQLTGGVTYGEDGTPLLHYKIEKVRDWPFSVRVMRDKDGYTYGYPIWSSELGGLIITENFVQVTTSLPPGSRVYGLGEHRHTRFRRGIIAGTWAMFARNQPPDWMLDSNLYGAHPFVLVIDKTGKAHGILFYNAAPAEISVTPLPSLIWRAIGGMPDIFIFTGPTPDSVLMQLTQVIGRSLMPPRWLLGLHVCFSGARNLTELSEMKRHFDRKGLPWSVMCLRSDTDESLMSNELTSVAEDKKISLTYSSKVVQHEEFTSRSIQKPYVGRSIPLQIRGRELIVPSCLARSRTYKKPFSIVTNEKDGQRISFFWDPMEKEILDYIVPHLQKRWQTTPFDLLELDDNQPYINYAKDDAAHCYEYTFTYITKAGYRREMRSNQAVKNYTTETLSRATLCMSALHRNCSVRHIDMHNAYGMFFANAVKEAWRRVTNDDQEVKNRKKPIMSSSTYPGSGRLGGHWVGRTFASWHSMSASVMSILEMNWFGISLSGDSVCGEHGPGSLEMCSHWATLAAFYPVVRFDYNRGRRRFMTLLKEPTFLSIFQRSLAFRSHIFPYLFTAIYDNAKTGNAVWKPLFHMLSSDNNLADEYHSFMIGEDLLISPVLKPATGMLVGVQLIPGYRWFHLKSSQDYDFCSPNGEPLTNDHRIDARILRRRSKTRKRGSVSVEGPENFVYLRGGSIVPVMSQVESIIDPFTPLTDGEADRLEMPFEPPSTANVSVENPLHISLLVATDCTKNKRGRLSRGYFYWESGKNDAASVYIKMLLTKEYRLEARMSFMPIRRAENLPPTTPGPPWIFEVIIDHIYFYGINTSRFFPEEPPVTTPSPRHHNVKPVNHPPLELGNFGFGAGLSSTTTESTTTTTTTTESTTTSTTTQASTTSKTRSMEESVVEITIKQTVGGDKMLTQTRHATAYYDWKRQLLVARNISLTVSDGDFTVSLKEPYNPLQTTTPFDIF